MAQCHGALRSESRKWPILKQQTQCFWLTGSFRSTLCPFHAGSIHLGPLIICQVPEAKARLPLAAACLIFSGARTGCNRRVPSSMLTVEGRKIAACIMGLCPWLLLSRIKDMCGHRKHCYGHTLLSAQRA